MSHVPQPGIVQPMQRTRHVSPPRPHRGEIARVGNLRVVRTGIGVECQGVGGAEAVNEREVGVVEEIVDVVVVGLTSSLKKHTFYNLLINNILYFCVT